MKYFSFISPDLCFDFYWDLIICIASVCDMWEALLLNMCRVFGYILFINLLKDLKLYYCLKSISNLYHLESAWKYWFSLNLHEIPLAVLGLIIFPQTFNFNWGQFLDFANLSLLTIELWYPNGTRPVALYLALAFPLCCYLMWIGSLLWPLRFFF